MRLDMHRSYRSGRAPINGFLDRLSARIDRIDAVDRAALGWDTEALIELMYVPGTLRDAVEDSLLRHPEVVEAWSVTGEADAIARVRTQGNADLERLIADLQRDGLVARTRTQVVLSQLVSRPRGL